MITLRLGRSLVAALYLVVGVQACVLSTFFAVYTGSWLAAVVAVASAGVVLRLVLVLARRHPRSPDRVVVMGGHVRPAVTPDAFLTFARHTLGGWTQEGIVMLVDHGGLFIPFAPARPMALGLLQAVFVPAARFADVSFDVGGTTPEALAEAARRYHGVLLGADWTWNAGQRWLHREPADGVLVLEHAPAADRMRAFRPAAEMTQAELRRAVLVAVSVGLLVSAALLAAGAIGASWSGDLEILGGLGAFAALIGGATLFAAFKALRSHRVGAGPGAMR